MSTLRDKFVWYELLTRESTAAAAFYSSVIGWGVKDAGMPEMNYTLLSAQDVPVAGLMELTQAASDMGARPSWIGYIGVTDVDAVTGAVQAAGGAIYVAPRDIPAVGRFAVVSDPQGAVFALFHGQEESPRPEAAPMAVGHVGWRELSTSDQAGAFTFYAGLFGWTKGEAIDMGPMGVYQIFAIDGVPAGGMMTRTDVAPGWLYYFTVAGIDAAVARVGAGGGQVVHGPQQVPGGSWIVQCVDPQGVPFALVGAVR